MKRIPQNNSKDSNNEKDSIDGKSYNVNKLVSKALNLMADEKLDDAAKFFEQALLVDVGNVEILLKLGYTRFHLGDYTEALKVYDNALDIDITNAEAWNLKSLIHYEQKNYKKALDCVDKSVDSDSTYGMAWYNKACFHSIMNDITESITALKRSIEIDVKNAKKAVKDKDFLNVKMYDGFNRIIEVVVLESIRQGYHTIGAIVWTTFINKIEVESALNKLLEKGFIIKHEKKQGFHKIPMYDLVTEMTKKIGTQKMNILTIMKKLPVSIKNLKNLSQSIQILKSSIEEENMEKTINGFEPIIDSTKCGKQMAEQFFEEHREIKLLKIRLKNNGIDYLRENKKKMLELLNNIEIKITKKLRSEIT